MAANFQLSADLLLASVYLAAAGWARRAAEGRHEWVFRRPPCNCCIACGWMSLDALAHHHIELYASRHARSTAGTSELRLAGEGRPTTTLPSANPLPSPKPHCPHRPHRILPPPSTHLPSPAHPPPSSLECIALNLVLAAPTTHTELMEPAIRSPPLPPSPTPHMAAKIPSWSVFFCSSRSSSSPPPAARFLVGVDWWVVWGWRGHPSGSGQHGGEWCAWQEPCMPGRDCRPLYMHTHARTPCS